jgi:cellulose synthase/poly-beta-1,6-N-acetylglucosamine synthase-like glycosyltransferase
MTALLLGTYFSVLGVLSLLGVYRLVLVRAALVVPRRPEPALLTPDAPRVAVQLPLYNEALVAERLLRRAARLRYPAGRLSIQVLDDSTDETRTIVDKVAEQLRGQGTEITVLRRDHRQGFKAGALALGLSHTDAELLAIFDADFFPNEDFLEKTVPVLLADPRRVLVQARWGHLNREASLLTRAQATYLDAHFAIEHQARCSSGLFFNFNGTAGVWRRRAIEGAGGWSADTITEDLDLSYRAQLAGGLFQYLDDVVAPAELPQSWSAFRSQQSRWVRGSVETARKHLGAVLRRRSLSKRVRADAALHLTNNFAYLLMALLAVLLPPSVILRNELAWRVPGGQGTLSVLDLSMLTAGTCAFAVFYLAASMRIEGGVSLRRAVDIAFALCVGAGMSLTNAREIIRGLTSKRSIFVRTPKHGDVPRALALLRYAPEAHWSMPLLELIFASLYLGATIYAVSASLMGALPFLLLYLLGFLATGGGTLLERYKARAHVVQRAAMAHFTSSR